MVGAVVVEAAVAEAVVAEAAVAEAAVVEAVVVEAARLEEEEDGESCIHPVDGDTTCTISARQVCRKL